MGFQLSCDGASGRKTQGYCAPTKKTKRAEIDGRARRVHAALATPTSPVWVPTESYPSRSDALTQSTDSEELWSPEAQARKQRASKLSAGLTHQILKQLAEDRARLAERLQTLAAACSEALAAHALPGPSGSFSPGASSAMKISRKEGKRTGRVAYTQAYAKGRPVAPAKAAGITAVTATAATALPHLGNPQKPPTSHSSSVTSLERTHRRTHTPPTTLRRVVTAASRPRRQSPAQSWRRTSPALPRAEGVSSTVGALTQGPVSTGAGGSDGGGAAAATTATGPGFLTPSYVMDSSEGLMVGARRRLFHKASCRDPPFGESSYLMSAVASPVLPSAPHSVADAPFSAALPSAACASAAGSRSATVTWLDGKRAKDPMDLGTLPVAAGAATAALTPALQATPPRLAWHDPTDLPPPGSSKTFSDARDSDWPATWTLRRPQMTYNATDLDHRERLRAGMAELNAELYSSWRALVDSGLI